MINPNDALQLVLEQSRLLETEEVILFNGLGRVLAEDIISDMDMPPFDKSAFDGYACRRLDLTQGIELQVIEVIPAGSFPKKSLGPLQCSKIMTGAPIPVGCDCILPVENASETGENTICCDKVPNKHNISFKAEDIKQGDLLMTKGTRLSSKHIPALASVGYAKIKVYKKVKVGIISTGSELVEPDVKPNNSQIRNSNGYQLYAQLLEIGAQPNYIGIVVDDEEITFNAIKKGIEENDVLLLTGGVSMGDFDFIPKIFIQLGIKILFDRVAIQPGKPSTFGVCKDALVFGLPGNPVSAFVIFELFAKPLLYKMMGFSFEAISLQLPLSASYKRKNAERQAWIPARINDFGEAEIIDYHGSAHINAMILAHAIIQIPHGVSQLEKGEKVYARLI